MRLDPPPIEWTLGLLEGPPEQHQGWHHIDMGTSTENLIESKSPMVRAENIYTTQFDG